MGAWATRSAAQTGGLLDQFMNASSYLTGHPGLDATLGQRLLEALARHDGAFPQQLQTLTRRIQAGVPADRVAATLGGEGDLIRDLPLRIVTAWYLGEVGERRPEPAPRDKRSAREPAPISDIVAYEAALMFVPVADVLTVPSYCRDVPGYWAKAPGGART